MKKEIKKSKICCYPDGHGGYEWSKEGVGFGTFYFWYDENNNLHCANEFMSKDFIKEMLCAMVDSCILDDTK